METQNSQSPAPRPFVVPSLSRDEGGKAGILSSPLFVSLLFVVVLGLGIFLGKTFFSTSPKENSRISATPTVVVAPNTTEATSGAEMANWKTYKNEEFGYSIQYPPEWSQRYYPYVAQLNLLTQGKSLSITWGEHAADPANLNTCVSQKRSLKTKSGILILCNYIYKDGSYNWQTNQALSDKDTIGVIISATIKVDSINDRNLIDQILSTFKFTK